MRTVLVPLSEAVRAELDALDPQLRAVTEGYIARLALEPYLGHPLERGLLRARRARAVRFDRDWRPENLLAGREARLRRGGRAPGDGPPWRVVYLVRERPELDVRLIVVLAVGRVHREPGERDAYDVAKEAIERMERRKR